MNYIDLILAALLLWAAIRGFIKGFILEASSLLALILGIYGAVKFSDYVAGFLLKQFGFSGSYVSIVAFLLTFAAIALIIHLLGSLFDKLAKSISLGPINRILGILFGLIKSAFLLSVSVLVLNTIDNHIHFLPSQDIQQSKIWKPLSIVAPTLIPAVKNSFFHIPPVPDATAPENEESL